MQSSHPDVPGTAAVITVTYTAEAAVSPAQKTSKRVSNDPTREGMHRLGTYMKQPRDVSKLGHFRMSTGWQVPDLSHGDTHK